MSDKLTKEEVLHVANLAKIEINDMEIEEYQIKLKKLMDDISKIEKVEIEDDNMLIAPLTHVAELRDDVEDKMLEAKEVVNNAPRKSGNFIEVPAVIKD